MGFRKWTEAYLSPGNKLAKFRNSLQDYKLCKAYGRMLSKKITATKLRKVVSTTVRENRSDLMEDLTDHMNHLSTIADKYYVTKKTRDKALGMSK